MQLSTLTVGQIRSLLEKYDDDTTVIFYDGIHTQNKIIAITDASQHGFYRTSKKEVLENLLVIDIDD